MKIVSEPTKTEIPIAHLSDGQLAVVTSASQQEKDKLGMVVVRNLGSVVAIGTPYSWSESWDKCMTVRILPKGTVIEV